MCQDYLNRMNEAGIDVILTPGSLMPAPQQGFLGKFPREINAAYTPWNLFNFPAGVVPVTKVNEQDELEMTSTFMSKGRVSRTIVWMMTVHSLITVISEWQTNTGWLQKLCQLAVGRSSGWQKISRRIGSSGHVRNPKLRRDQSELFPLSGLSCTLSLKRQIQ